MLVCLSVCLSVWQIGRPNNKSKTCLIDTDIFIYFLFVCLSVRPSVCLSVHPSIHLSVRPSFCLSVRPSACQSVRFSVCLSAGTDSGESWNSGNQVTSPAQPIARITATSSRTTVYRKTSGSTASMGTITFDLVSTSATDDAGETRYLSLRSITRLSGVLPDFPKYKPQCKSHYSNEAHTIITISQN